MVTYTVVSLCGPDFHVAMTLCLFLAHSELNCTIKLNWEVLSNLCGPTIQLKELELLDHMLLREDQLVMGGWN